MIKTGKVIIKQAFFLSTLISLLGSSAFAQGNVVVAENDDGLVYKQGPGGRLVVTFKLHEEDTGGVFELITEDHFAGFKSRPHVHPTASETFIITEGQYEYEIGDKKGVAGPGTVLHVPPNTIHILHAIEGGQVFMIYTPPELEQRTKVLNAMTEEERAVPGARQKLSAEYGHVAIELLEEKEQE